MPYSVRFLPSLCTVAMIFVWLGTASSASANIAAATRAPSGFSQMTPLQPTKMHVLNEQLSIVCTEDTYTEPPTCRFEAVYTVHNPTETPETVVGAFYGIRLTNTEIEINDTPSTQTAAPSELRTLHERFIALDDNAPNRKDTHANTTHTHSGLSTMSYNTYYSNLQRHSFVLNAPPNTTHTLRVRGNLAVRPRRNPSYLLPAPNTRHIFASNYTPENTYDVDYLLSPIRTWASVGPITVHITTPNTWTLSAQSLFVNSSLLAYFAERSPDYTVQRAEAIRARPSAPREIPLQTSTSNPTTQTATFTLSPDNPLPDALSVHFDRPRPLLEPGGPIAAIGGALKGRGGLRLRAGYELTATETTSLGLHYDTDLSHIHTVTPTVTFASPMLIVLPSMALTVGVPVQIEPDATAGVRLQTELQFPILGLVSSFDIYPTHDGLSNTPLFEALLMAQISL